MAAVIERKLRSSRRAELVDITAEVAEAIRSSGVDEGLCVVFSPHTTGGLTVNEAYDPDVARDIERSMERLSPRDGDYLHAEGNSDAHLKTSLFGPSVTLIIADGKPALGTWQGIFFCESDGPRDRTYFVKCLEG